MVRCRKTNFRISVIRPIDQGIGRFSLCAARHWTKRIRPFTPFDRDGGDDRLRLTGYGYSCSGIDARSNEKPYSTMRAAPDGFHRLGEARVGSQLPELLNKKSSYRRCADWKLVLEH
jgi:hypothetical protein